jgi:hypothetical protein
MEQLRKADTQDLMVRDNSYSNIEFAKPMAVFVMLSSALMQYGAFTLFV